MTDEFSDTDKDWLECRLEAVLEMIATQPPEHSSMRQFNRSVRRSLVRKIDKFFNKKHFTEKQKQDILSLTAWTIVARRQNAKQVQEGSV